MGSTFWSPAPGVMDKHVWRLSSSGQYTAKSAYDALLQGAVSFGPWERIWKSWAPAKCRFLLCLVAHNRCWTADWLAQRGLLHHEACPLATKNKRPSNISWLLVFSPTSFGFYYYRGWALLSVQLRPWRLLLMIRGAGLVQL